MSKANGYDTGDVFKNAALLVLPLWALMFVAVPVLTLLIAALAEALGFSIAIEHVSSTELDGNAEALGFSIAIEFGAADVLP